MLDNRGAHSDYAHLERPSSLYVGFESLLEPFLSTIISDFQNLDGVAFQSRRDSELLLNNRQFSEVCDSDWSWFPLPAIAVTLDFTSTLPLAEQRLEDRLEHLFPHEHFAPWEIKQGSFQDVAHDIGLALPRKLIYVQTDLTDPQKKLIDLAIVPLIELHLDAHSSHPALEPTGLPSAPLVLSGFVQLTLRKKMS